MVYHMRQPGARYDGTPYEREMGARNNSTPCVEGETGLVTTGHPAMEKRELVTMIDRTRETEARYDGTPCDMEMGAFIIILRHSHVRREKSPIRTMVCPVRRVALGIIHISGNKASSEHSCDSDGKRQSTLSVVDQQPPAGTVDVSVVREAPAARRCDRRSATTSVGYLP